MEQSLIALLEDWALRNPLLPALLLVPLALALVGVIASAWRSARRSAAPPLEGAPEAPALPEPSREAPPA
ncbi:MAG: hypothetical protein JRF15_15880, partial [Deltaproteobacteria bacterium]|nr:hypothetical protein [Deltaproteobacteria bacterium]